MYRDSFVGYNSNKEDFVEALMPLVNKLLPEEAHELRWTISRSVGTNPNAVKVHLLNCRYELAKKGKVRQECKDFLNFLENAENRDWNETVKALAVQAHIKD
jgi:hypothetical protein